jgi:hypothetical protein
MGSYLQQYLAEEERRNRIIKWIIMACILIVVAGIASYLIFHNYPEKQVVKHFLVQVNSRDYETAYRDWGCTTAHPCPNYDYSRFMEDWGPSKKTASPWKIASVDGCRTFVTVNVEAEGAELQSLAVQRNDHSLGFAPAPECQERKWHWKQFFQRIFGRS